MNRPAEALPRETRIAKRRDYLHTYETGRKLFSRFAVIFYVSNAGGPSRIGVTATRKLGKANVRNRLKRWTREVYRRQREPLELDAKALDIVVNVKNNAADATFSEYQQELTRVLQRLARGA